MNKKIFVIVLTLLIGTTLRLWQLGTIPPSPDWDEASLAYNAYSIVNTGRDEYGDKLPIVLKSFGDYKPALYAYLSIPSVEIFGLNTFAIRLPSAILGILSLGITYFLIRIIFKNDGIALLTTFLLAISPWHIQFSRIAFEANLGLTLVLSALLFFFYGLKKNFWYLILSAVFAALALYSYQAEKVFVPLISLLIIAIYGRELLRINKKYLISGVIAGFLVALPIFIYTFSNEQALSRAKRTGIEWGPNYTNFSIAHRNLDNEENKDLLGRVIDNRRVHYVKQVVANYLWHYDPNWLFVRGDVVNPAFTNLRHQATQMGNLYLWELPFVLMGVYLLFFGKYSKRTKTFIFGWFLLVPIPASITWDVPNSVRTLHFIPIFQLFTGMGLIGVYEFLKNRKWALVFWIILPCIFILNFAYYLNQYFVQYKIFSSQYWQYGYEKLIPEIKKRENSYDKVLISTKVPLDQSYIFFLFYLKYSPENYQKISSKYSGEYKSYHAFGNYEFKLLSLDEEKNKDILYVVGASEKFDRGKNKVLQTIQFLDGSPAFVLVDKKL